MLTLRCRIHPAHLHPRHTADAGKGGRNHGRLHEPGHVTQRKRRIGHQHPIRHSFHLSAHFGVWVTVWVRQLTHILTHTELFRKVKKNTQNPKILGAFWSCWADSNRRPHPYQGCALPTELQQQMATRKGLEPSTSGVTGRRSNQLNYRAIHFIYRKQIALLFVLAGAEGIEPSARGFGDRCSTC